MCCLLSPPLLFFSAQHVFVSSTMTLKGRADRQADRQRLEPEPARTVWGADDKNQTDVQTKHKSGDVKVRSDQLQSARKGTGFFSGLLLLLLLFSSSLFMLSNVE